MLRDVGSVYFIVACSGQRFRRDETYGALYPGYNSFGSNEKLKKATSGDQQKKQANVTLPHMSYGEWRVRVGRAKQTDGKRKTFRWSL